MSQDILELVYKMNRNSVETQLALQCAPFLAGLKLSNLLIISDDKEETLIQLVDDSDLSAYFLVHFNGKVVYLLYCHEKLEKLLTDKGIRSFFRREGYKALSIHAVLEKFKKRYEKHIIMGGKFPHEMGLILGYPIDDVRGFIENEGSNSLYTGYWKVYDKPEEKKLIFQSYEYATEKIIKLLFHGVTMRDIIKADRYRCTAI